LSYPAITVQLYHSAYYASGTFYDPCICKCPFITLSMYELVLLCSVNGKHIKFTSLPLVSDRTLSNCVSWFDASSLFLVDLSRRTSCRLCNHSRQCPFALYPRIHTIRVLDLLDWPHCDRYDAKSHAIALTAIASSSAPQMDQPDNGCAARSRSRPLFPTPVYEWGSLWVHSSAGWQFRHVSRARHAGVAEAKGYANS
jgi:hypothetical protein